MIREAIIAWAYRREPDQVVGDDPGAPYLIRWYLVPKNRFVNAYVHLFMRSDVDRELHDHPWLANLSVVLRGCYMEHTPHGEELRTPKRWVFRWGASPHRIELQGTPVWTLFITGPHVREWGFYGEDGWVHWRDFLNIKEK